MPDRAIRGFFALIVSNIVPITIVLLIVFRALRKAAVKQQKKAAGNILESARQKQRDGRAPEHKKPAPAAPAASPRHLETQWGSMAAPDVAEGEDPCHDEIFGREDVAPGRDSAAQPQAQPVWKPDLSANGLLNAFVMQEILARPRQNHGRGGRY